MRFWRGHDMCELIHRHRRPILVVAALATALGAYLTSRLSLESDLSALLPDGFESVQALERVREEVGGIGVLRVVLASSDFPALLRFAEDLEPRLEANEFVREVEYRNDVAFYESHALLYLDTLQLDSLRVAIENEIEAGKQEINPFIVEDLFGEEEEEPGAGLEDWETRYRELLPRPYFTNEDSTVLVLQVFPSQPDANLDFSRRMRDEITSIVAGLGPESYAPDMEVRYGGNIQNRIVEYETLKHDILGTAVYGVGAVFALIALYFRSLVVAALIASSLVAALGDDECLREVAAALTKVARVHDLKVVAEGVADRALVELATELGCDYLQGFAFTEPLPQADFLTWLVKYENRSVA